jgi:hypothetical protein
VKPEQALVPIELTLFDHDVSRIFEVTPLTWLEITLIDQKRACEDRSAPSRVSVRSPSCKKTHRRYQGERFLRAGNLDNQALAEFVPIEKPRLQSPNGHSEGGLSHGSFKTDFHCAAE